LLDLIPQQTPPTQPALPVALAATRVGTQAHALPPAVALPDAAARETGPSPVHSPPTKLASSQPTPLQKSLPTPLLIPEPESQKPPPNGPANAPSSGSPHAPPPNARSPNASSSGPARRPSKPTRDEIETIYAAYPRKVGSAKAKAEIARALGKVTFDRLLAAVQLFALSRVGQDPHWTPHPERWFSKERWNDDPREWQRGPGSSGTPRLGPGQIYDPEAQTKDPTIGRL
jgi:hypothetical protein